LPYFNYVDEGHFLRRVSHLLSTQSWDPGWYAYPSLPFYAVAGAAVAWSPLYSARHGHPLRQDLSPFGDFYDVLEPVDLIVIGRLATLLLSLAAVALLGRMAARFAGEPAGWIAALAAALLPALVIRGGIVTVDVYALLAVLGALELADRARLSPRPGRQLVLALLAGVCSGLAFVSKYPTVLVSLGVALSLLLAGWTWRRKLLALLLAGAGAVAAILLGMPVLWLRTAAVLADLRLESGLYATMPVGSYWDQIFHRAEWDQPLTHPELGWPYVLLALAGLAVALADRRWRLSVLPWVLYSVATIVLFSRFPFHAFRNFLPLAALSTILVALLFARLRERASRPGWVTAGAALLLVLLFAVPLHQYVGDRLRLVDSRVQAVDWLAKHGDKESPALLLEQIAFQPAELARLPQPVIVRPWPRARRALEPRFGVRYLVLAELAGPNALLPLARQEILAAFDLKARFGSEPTPASPGWFQGNRQIVYVLERR